MVGRLPVRDTARQVARVYREDVGFLIGVALLVFIPLTLVEAAVEPLQEVESEDVGGSTIFAALAAIFVSAASGTLGEEFYIGVVMAVVTQAIVGKPRPSLRTVARTTPYLRLIGVSLLFAFGLALGLVFLIVPGVVFFTWFVLAAPLVKIEDLGVLAAFRRSRQLERGNFWRVLVLVGSVFVLSESMTLLLQEIGGDWLGHSLTSEWVLGVVVAVIVLPIWAVAVDVTAWRLVHMERAAASE